jgi:hypothetical protein
VKTVLKRSKYGSSKAIVGGITFHSRAEAARYTDLVRMQAAGVISDLQLQVRFPLMGVGSALLRIVSEGYPKGRVATYVADFVYVEAGQTVIEDVKGMATPEYKLKKAIMACMGHQIREYKRRG